MSHDAFIADNGIGIGPTFHCHLGLRHQQVRPTLTFDDACYTEQVATVMVATARITAAAQIIPSYSPGGVNVHTI